MPNRSRASGASSRLRVRGVLFAVVAALVVTSLAARAVGAPAPFVFVASALAMSMLAWLLGVATEELGAAAGPRISGVLNVAFGNIAELVITTFALRAGLSTVVKASITGSILGNMLLVLGFCLVLAGLRFGDLRFSRTMAATNASLLMIAVIGLAVPAVFARTAPPGATMSVERLSVGVAGILLVAYLLSLVFFFRTPSMAGAELARVRTGWSIKRSIVVLALTGVFMTVVGDTLVDAIRPTLAAWGITEIFAGVILIPIIGNIAEHTVAMQLAYQNDLDFSLIIALGSSLQIALFVGPLLVFLSLLIGQPMDLVFTPLELATVGFGVLTVALVAGDGESNWFEGVELVAVYAIVALAFYFYPG